MTITIELPEVSALDSVSVKIAVEKIAKNFAKDNLIEIAKLSDLHDANNKLKKLFNNPLFKMALK